MTPLGVLAESVARTFLSVIRKEKGEYCVKSPNNPDWNGGCYKSKEDSEKRLQQVEFFKYKKEAEVVARLFTAGLGETLTHKIEGLFASYNDDEAGDVAAWFIDNFRFDNPKTPKGQKDLKEKASSLHWFLRDSGVKWGNIDGQKKRIPGNPKSIESAKQYWYEDVKPKLADLVRYFTDEGGTIVPKELTLKGNTYINLVGFDEKKLSAYANRVEDILDSLHGWRKAALAGGVKVALASPREFHGTAGGTYRRENDTLFVRATPDVLKRGAGLYGNFEYIVIHEIGHRYEAKNRPPIDFDRPEWWTSKYSRREGEAFAELFALGHFGMTKDASHTWDPKIQEKFEKRMG